MKHDVTELYRISGKRGLYTEDYVVEYDLCGFATPVYSVIQEATPLNTCNGIVMIYWFGERTWFDTMEERDAYRVEYQIEREKKMRRNQMLKKIQTFSDEELEEIVAKYSL